MNKTSPPHRSWGLASLFVVAFMYGSWGPLAREADVMFSYTGQAAVRQAVGLAVLVALVIFRRPALRIPRGERWPVVVIGGAASVTGITWTVAANNTTVANATFMFYVGVILTTSLTGWLIHRESMTLTRAASCVLAVGGLAMYAEPVAALSVGVVSGMVAGIASGTVATCMRFVSDLPRFTVMLYQFLFGTIVGFALVAVAQEPVVEQPDWSSLVALVIFGVAVVAVSWLLLFGFSRVDVSVGGVILSGEIPFALLLGFLIYSETPSTFEAVGGALVLVGAIVGSLPSRLAMNTLWRRPTKGATES